MGKIKYFLILSTILLFICCQGEFIDRRVTYYPSGEIKFEDSYQKDGFPSEHKEYFKSGRLKLHGTNERNFNGSKHILYSEKGDLIAKKIFKNSKSAIQYEYYENKALKCYGPTYNNKNNGWWTFYDRQGKVMRKDEIFTIDGKKILNQRIEYDLAGKIMESKSDIFEVVVKDTLKVGRSIGMIHYNPQKNYTRSFRRNILGN